MDLIAFFATLFGLITNPFGFTDALNAAAAMVAAGADKGQLKFREWLGRNLARPVRNFMWFCCFGLLMIVIFAGVLHFSVLTAAEQGKGIFGTFVVVSLISILFTFAFAAWQGSYVIGRTPEVDDQPLKISYVWCAIVLTSTVALISVTLSLHALYVESSALWLLSMITRYLGLLVVAAITVVVAWVIHRGGGFIEWALQLAIEIVVPIVPGVTAENVRQRLFPNGLNLLDEEEIAALTLGITGFLAVTMLPFDLVVLPFATTTMVTIFGGAYIVGLCAAWLANKVGLRDMVEKGTRRFVGFLFTFWPWVAALSFGAWRIACAWAPAPVAAIEIWGRRLLHGDVRLFHEYPWYTNVFFILVGLTALTVFSLKLKSSLARVITVGISGIFTLYFFGGLLVNFGVTDGTTPMIEAKTLAEETTIRMLASCHEPAGCDQPTVMHTADSWVKIGWQTPTASSDCQVEIMGVSAENKPEYVHPVYKPTVRKQALSDQGRQQHFFTFNDLAPGMKVTFRIRVTRIAGLEGDPGLKGLTTVTRIFEVSIPFIRIPSLSAPSATTTGRVAPSKETRVPAAAAKGDSHEAKMAALYERRKIGKK